MIKIGILGYSGRMGQLIAQAVDGHKSCVLVGGYVRKMKPEYKRTKNILITDNADELIPISDVLIDFTSPEKASQFATLVSKYGKALVCGTTGLDAKARSAFAKASKKIPVLVASNTSLSLVVIKQVAELAAKLLANFDYDVAILDEHHRMKKDAPSGTAKTLGEAVLRGNKGKKKPQYAAIRSGHIVGEHDILFAGQGECIRLHHSVTDRGIFARGAVQAALWLHRKKPGLYAMEDVLGIK